MKERLSRIEELNSAPFSNQASQSGLEAAKESLRAIQRKNKEIKDQTPHLEDGKVSIPFWPSNSDSSASPNLAWVRTAAQAAMALKVHGMLETTGMNSASARLQHASLPAFGPSARSPSWDDHDNGASARAVTADANVNAEGNNFEEGVVSVQSELQSGELIVGDDGYDLLPLPVPAPERRILSVGSDASSQIVPRETRFHYGSMSMPSPFSVDEDDKAQSAYLGDISVDDNIDKLREVIGSVDNTLSRCLASIGGVGNAQKERQTLHLEIVKGLDSWGGMRGKFISQRSLLKGVSGIEQSKDLYEEGDLSLIDGTSCQSFTRPIALLSHGVLHRYLMANLVGQVGSDSGRRRALSSASLTYRGERQGCSKFGCFCCSKCLRHGQVFID